MVPRQHLPEVYCLNGLFYLAGSDYILKKNSFFSKKTSAFIVEKKNSFNSHEDLILLKKNKIIDQNFLKE